MRLTGLELELVEKDAAWRSGELGLLKRIQDGWTRSSDAREVVCGGPAGLGPLAQWVFLALGKTTFPFAIWGSHGVTHEFMSLPEL